MSPEAKYLNWKFVWLHVTILGPKCMPIALVPFSAVGDALKAMSNESEETDNSPSWDGHSIELVTTSHRFRNFLSSQVVDPD
jgi:hypothetical protein